MSVTPGSHDFQVFGGKLEPEPTDAQQRLRWARRRWLEVKTRDLEEIDGGLIADRGSGRLYRICQFDPILSSANGDGSEYPDLLVFDDGGRPGWLEPVTSGPATVDELHQSHVAREQAEQRYTHGLDEARRKQPKRDVTLSDLHERELPTLRAAACTLLGLRGQVTVEAGRLRVQLPELLEPNMAWALEDSRRAQVRDAVTVLLAGRHLVVEALENPPRRGEWTDQLPDAQLGVDGVPVR